VAKRLHGISRGTVFRALDALAEMGFATRVSHPGGAARYDGRVDHHHHIVCDRCGTMEDLDSAAVDAARVPIPRRPGYRIADYSIHFRGLCATCATAAEESKP
jgi:Fe2+ or Zn2+ uptake regulation protein